MSLPPLDSLLLRAGGLLLATTLGGLALGRRWAKASDPRRWSEV